jgi:hypothetical protein
MNYELGDTMKIPNDNNISGFITDIVMVTKGYHKQNKYRVNLKRPYGGYYYSNIWLHPSRVLLIEK